MATAARSPRAVHGTVVFTDIVGFTEYTALRGDEEALALLSSQERLVQDALPAGARVVKELGDGLLLWFPDALQALDTSLRLQDRFGQESSKSTVRLWVRMGIHSGQQTRRGNDLVGHDVNVASRVVDVAGPGEILVSEATRAEIKDRLPEVCFDELGPVVMKGIPAPVRLYRAMRDRLSSGRATPASV
jgi:adenylate cyclase